MYDVHNESLLSVHRASFHILLYTQSNRYGIRRTVFDPIRAPLRFKVQDSRNFILRRISETNTT